MRDAVIVEAVRTPVGKGKPGGALADVHPVALLAHTLRELVARSGIDPELVDDVIGGTVSQVGEQAANLTRYAWLSAGLPESVAATTVDRQCGSSQQAVHFAAQGVISGAYDIVVACGVESMSRVPMGSNVLPGSVPFGPGIPERYPDGLVPQGVAAELIAAKWGLTREAMDAYSAASHAKAAHAAAEGWFEAEIAPVRTPSGLVTADESIRPSTTPEVLAKLRPAFERPEYTERFPQITWSVTAGSSSPINDGAAALLIMSGETAARLGLRPLARLSGVAVAGADPLMMLTAIMPATEKLLRRTGVSLDEVGLYEVNEAFASVPMAWLQETGADPARLNAHGGAIAIGHPLGASGARIMTTLVHAMHRHGARYALQTMCEAGGLANATLLERL
ncbi:thiolase family protein [Actinocorallia sp. A-T 12471]|uniref:thiolase family protein n=1 Tax=Actinocorallia sp. A-T 12471 TaxID=3089813 RepID=UPI0029CBEBBB|nr:thiolase family protein [Actinocorallia sp. A-T 12471]MDX6741274.1 thiolase family protein [Actinocorallia sp. A-T 12471]